MAKATCTFCQRQMTAKNGCEIRGYKWGAKTYSAIPFGIGHSIISKPVCHDCGVGKGQFHHPGCDMEECPICRGQLISCEHSSVLDQI